MNMLKSCHRIPSEVELFRQLIYTEPKKQIMALFILLLPLVQKSKKEKNLLEAQTMHALERQTSKKLKLIWNGAIIQ